LHEVCACEWVKAVRHRGSGGDVGFDIFYGFYPKGGVHLKTNSKYLNRSLSMLSYEPKTEQNNYCSPYKCSYISSSRDYAFNFFIFLAKRT